MRGYDLFVGGIIFVSCPSQQTGHHFVSVLLIPSCSVQVRAGMSYRFLCVAGAGAGWRDSGDAEIQGDEEIVSGAGSDGRAAAAAPSHTAASLIKQTEERGTIVHN